MQKKQLIQIGFEEAEAIGVEVSRTFMMRLVTKTMKRMEYERRRLEAMLVDTPDCYSVIAHSDPTGEQAVRNVIRRALVA